MIRPRTAARMTLLSVGATMLGVLGFAGPAAAHVSVSADEAVQGGYVRVAFRVPNESDTAATNKVEVFLPADAPVASVSTMAVPGWTVALTTAKPATPVQAEGSQVSEVVTKLTWTASPAAVIRAGQFQEFPVSMGPLPAVDRLVFKALQTYSDGNVVRWIEEPAAAGAEEPQSPAPVLALAKATAPESVAPESAAQGSAAQESAAQGSAAQGSAAPVAAPGDAGDSDGDGVAVALGAAGLVTGLAGLALGGLAFARTRKAPVAPTS